MNLENKIFIIGGIVLLLLSIVYLDYGITNKICSSVGDTDCFSAFINGIGFVVGSIFIGIGFGWKGFAKGEKKE